MKIINENLLKLKIKISCKDSLAYQDVAYLVDKPDFLRILPKLRDKYAIKELIPLSEYTKWLEQLIRRAPSEFGGKKGWVESAKKLYKEQSVDFKKIYSSLSTYERFDWETKLLTRKFKRPGYFDLIIKHAIVCGEITDESWNHTYADVRPWELPTSEVLLPEVSIVISPMTRPKDVEKAFKEAKKLINKNSENLKYLTVVKRTEAKDIRRNRRWYWKSLEGKMSGDIYDEEFLDEKPKYDIQKHPRLDIDLASIDRVIGRYSDILKNY